MANAPSVGWPSPSGDWQSFRVRPRRPADHEGVRAQGQAAGRPAGAQLRRLSNARPVARGRYALSASEGGAELGRIVISENVSLDGVIQDPAGDEGFSRGGWVGRIGGQGREEAAAVLLDEARGADVLLLGRRTYQFFAGRWPSRSGSLADRLNELPKYVVSSTLEDPGWNNSTVLTGEAAELASRLKLELDGEILVYGSIQLARTLIEHDVANELRLMIYPVVLGAGERLFGETRDTKPMRRVETRAVGDDLAYVTYEFVSTADVRRFQ
jgi:dihydrofolate reductase